MHACMVYARHKVKQESDMHACKFVANKIVASTCMPPGAPEGMYACMYACMQSCMYACMDSLYFGMHMS